jgi:RNA polymerase primary sigma factor
MLKMGEYEMNYSNYLIDVKFPSKEKQIELINKIKNNKDELAYNEFISKYIPMVIKIATKYIAFYEIEDLIQEGILGLMKSIEKFDYKRDVSFSTYATFWIHQYIRRFLANNSRLIRLPVNIHDALISIKKNPEKYNYHNLKFISDCEIQIINIDKISDTQLIFNNNFAENSISNIYFEILKNEINNILSEKEKIIFWMSFFEKTTKDIAILTNISKKEVLKILQKSIRKLKSTIKV